MESANILIVEDDAIITKSLQHALRNAGYTVCGIVKFGEAALQHVASVPTDLVLMDILLPGAMNGIEAADAISKKFHLPVIYISANSTQEVVDQAKLTAPYGFLIKPFHAREIQVTIEMALYKSRMERQLRENEAKYRNIINQATEIIGVLQDGHFILANDTTLAMTGYSVEETTSTPYLEFIAPDDRQLVSEIVNKRFQGIRTPYSIEIRLIHRNGSLYWIESRSTLIDWESRPALLVFANDITDRKRAEEELLCYQNHLEELVQQRTAELSGANAQLSWEINERKQMERSLLEQSTFLENIISGIQEGIGIIDANETLQFCNRAFAFIFEEGIERLLGEHLRVFFDDENWAHLLRETELRKQGKISTYELCLRTRQGRKKFIQITESPRFGEAGEYAGSFAVVLDITERKEREIELQRAKEDAEAANAAKNEFLASMSHELRTPLHAVLGFAQLIKNDPTLSARQQNHAAIIERNGNHLLILLNDILDLSKYDAGQLESTSSLFYLSQALTPVREIAQFSAEQKQLVFAFDVDPSLPEAVFGDEKRLRQILTNIVGNAVKFTSQGAVTLRVRLLEMIEEHQQCGTPCRKAKVHFEVEDTGIGIPQHAISRIFLPFEHAKNRRLYSDGAGLGLTLCQRFARMMGSELHVRSAVGKGSVFWFDIAFPTHEADESCLPPECADILDAAILPPRDTLERLHRFALSGDILAIRDILHELEAANAPYAEFIALLLALAQQWQIDRIQASLSQALSVVAKN